MRELTEREIALVSGGDAGDSTVAGGIAGATGGYRYAKATFTGARIGSAAGPVGAVVGGVLGAATAYFTYEIATSS